MNAGRRVGFCDRTVASLARQYRSVPQHRNGRQRVPPLALVMGRASILKGRLELARVAF
jgi:hypothetical protein